MKLPLLSLAAPLLALHALALDSTPPSLSVPHAWVEKAGTQYAFKLLLDPQDETGVDKVQYRYKVNSTLALPDSTAWVDYSAWQRGTPLSVQAAAKSFVIEVRALDAAGNPSPLQRRAFASPFPVSAAPNLEPKFVADKIFPGSGPTLDCRGLYGADFDGDGRDDILQVDRASGIIKVRRQQSDGTFVSNGFTVTANAVTDSAMGDFNGDGRPDIALVINSALVVYQNDGLTYLNASDLIGTLHFSAMNVAGFATTGITAVVGIAAGDVTSEGKDDLIITGTGASDTRVAIILHNDQFQLSASNYAVVPATSTAGVVRIGDVTGDGWADAVMIDAANNQVLTFINKGNGSFGGADDVDTAARPIATSTGSVPAQSIAVGDVTGDGRADLVITKQQFGDYDVTGQFRDYLFTQFFDSRGAAPFRSNGLLDAGAGPVATSSTAIRSDVMLMDLNDDRFPEIVVASPFVGTGGVRAWRMNCLLDNANLATFVDSYSFSYTTGAASPHRLASGRYQSSRADVLLASGDNAEAVQFVFSTYSPSSKTYDLITGASTDTDPNGSVGTNGALSYSVDVGGAITYSLHYVNNTTTAVTGGVVECLLPANLSVMSGDAGYTVVPSGTSNYIRWTVDVPAGTSGVKPFSVRVLSGVNGAKLALKGNFKRGSTTLVSTAMPVVTLEEPLALTVSTVTTSDSFGQRAHIGETITYRLKVKNVGSGTISNFKLGMSTPAGTTLFGSTSPPNPVLTGTYPNITALTWNNLSLLPDASLTLEVQVQVKSTTTTGTIIKNTTATVTRSDEQKVVAPPINVRIDPPLEITLSSDKNIVQPGDTIRYTFTVKNWLTTNFTNAKVVDKLPTGVALLTAGANDAVDSSVGGNGNFVYSAGTWTAAQLSTSTLPAYDRSTGIMTWVLNTLPAGVQRNIQFDVIVAQDIPTTFNIGGVSTTLEVQNKSYNLVGTSSTNARIFAGTPAGGSAANALTATSDKLLSSVLTARRSLLSDPPLAEPRLVLFKTASGNFSTIIAGETFATIINDAANATDGICDYTFTYENAGPGTGINVVIHDYIPTGMTFVGNIKKDLIAVPSLVGYRFYDAAGKEMQVIGAEGFTDTNGNGFYDVGEVYNDANGNKKYDGVTASLVRSIDFPAGNVAGNGGGGFFSYRTRTTSTPGAIIVSDAGGLTGVKDGLTYTKVKGYHITADNLHFPSNGNPKQVKALITGPAYFSYPQLAIKSRAEMVGDQITEIGIPFEVLNASSLTLSGCKMTVTIPKGYLVPTAELRDRSTAGPNSFPATITRNASTGITTVTFPIDFRKEGDAVFQVKLDSATKSVLKGTNGQIKVPLRIEPTITGGYVAGSKVVPITSITRLLASLPVRDTVTTPPGPPMARGVLAPPPAPLADAKIFVGRCAPVSVKRGDTFGYTIFVGNLTDLALSIGTIEMNVPTGCDFVSASFYNYNVPGATPSTDAGGTFGIAPKRVGTKVTWTIGAFAAREGGAVTLTVKVRDDFTGTRIDDNSCIFDVINASGKTPGPLGVVVRSGNETTQSNEIASSAASGFGMSSSSDVTNALLQSFALQAASCSITTGGTDLLQLNNGVAVIQLGGGRVMTVGPPDKIVASGIRLVKDDAMMRVAVGPGDSGAVQLTKLPTLSANLVQPANTLLANLHNSATSLVAAGGGNMVAAGGGNMVAAGGGNLIGMDGSTLIGNDGSTFTGVATLVAAGGGNLIGMDGSTMVAAGGGNMVAAGGGNLVAAGGGHLIGNDGSTISPLVAAGAGNLIGQDGSTMVAAGGGNLVAAGGGNLVAAGGLNLIPNPKQ